MSGKHYSHCVMLQCSDPSLQVGLSLTRMPTMRRLKCKKSRTTKIVCSLLVALPKGEKSCHVWVRRSVHAELLIRGELNRKRLEVESAELLWMDAGSGQPRKWRKSRSRNCCPLATSGTAPDRSLNSYTCCIRGYSTAFLFFSEPRYPGWA